MSTQPGEQDFSAVCPYLGLADDADSHATYATEAHRCYRLPNPTRIATGHQETYCLGANHVSCPVYLGEGVPGAAAAAAATAAAGAAAPPAATTRTAGAPPAPRGPQGRDLSGRPSRPPGQPGNGARPARRPPGGAIGPRPRAGGVSMPVATIGLFALAIVVIVLAFGVNKLVGGGSDNGISSADTLRTTTAQKTQAAAGGSTAPANQTATNQTATNKTPGTNQTPGANQTPGNNGTAPAGGAKYTVKSGDSCSSIAESQGVTLQQLEQANNLTDDTCPNIQVGQQLTIPGH